jgi:transcriptional regulator with XRE-family HTH domain
MPQSRRNWDADVAAEFGKRLRLARLAAGWSQEQMADAAKVHRTYIGRAERGETNPTLITIVMFAEALDLDPCDLVQGLRR